MIDNANITVLIVGNPDASSGESVLLNINNSPLKSNELGKTFYDAITSDYYIEVVHGEEYMSYTYVVNPVKVHSEGSNRPGMFWIGVTVSKGKQIANTYDLLIELKDKFQELYMTKLSDGSYEFINKDYSAVEFRKIVDKYNTVTSSSEYCQMNGKYSSMINLISNNTSDSGMDKIKVFLDNSQYTEFKGYSSVIVAEDISVPVVNIEVRTAQVYTVKAANGYGEIKSKYNENIIDNRFNTKFRGNFYKNDYYELVQISFKISDIGKNKSFDNFEYEIDNNNGIIYIKPKYPPKKYKVYIQFGTGTNIMDLISIKSENSDQIVEIENDAGGYYIEFEGENIRTYLTIIKKDCNDICDYSIQNPSVDKDIDTIIVNVVENSTFNGVRISNIPYDKNRKLILKIDEDNYSFTIDDNYTNSNYQIEIHDIEKITSRYINSDAITDCHLESQQYFSRSYGRNYHKKYGWLVFDFNN